MQYGKNWNEPIIFQHNGRIDKVYVSVDRRRGKIIPRFEDGGKTAAGNTYTKIVLTLPVAMTKEYYKSANRILQDIHSAQYPHRL